MFGDTIRPILRAFVAFSLIAPSAVALTVTTQSEVALAAPSGSRDPAFETLLGSQAFGDGGTSTGVNAAVQLGSYIYFGGSFLKTNGDATIKYLAKYDPATDTVSAVDEWQGGNVVNALATDGTYLFVGGSFVNHRSVATADHLVKYNPAAASGSKWAPMLRGTGQQVIPYATTTLVNSLVYNSATSTLYAGGYWGTLASPAVANTQNLLAITNLSSANSTVTAIANTSCLSPGIQQLKLRTTGPRAGDLYAVGYCARIAYTGVLGSSTGTIPYVARLSSGSWDAIASSGLTYTNTNSSSTTGLKYSTYHAAYPRAIAVDEDSEVVYVGGFFTYYGKASTDVDRVIYNGLMKANDNPASRTSWTAVSTGSSIGVYAATSTTLIMSLTWISGDGVYVGGGFTKRGGANNGTEASTGETNIRNLARIPGSGGSAGQIVVGGGGSSSGTAWLNSIVRGVVAPTSVTRAGVATNYLIPYGYFSNAAGIGSNDAVGLMATDASSWTSFGASAPLNNDVYAIAVTADNRYVYVGGDFTDVGGVVGASYLAVYDRTTKLWSIPTWWYSGSGTASRFKVRALKISGNYIYVAGVAETTTVTKGIYVYRADATQPAAVSPTTPTAVAGTKIAVGGTVNALEFDLAGRLVVGGSFTKSTETTNCNAATVGEIKHLFRVVLAGTEMCERIGTAAPLGDTATVRTIINGTVDGAQLLFVGGSFSNVDSDATIDNLAIWDDSGGSSGTGDWLGVGSLAGDGPIQSAVRALVLNGSILYVGGEFSDAGGVAAADFLAAVNLSTNSWSSLGTTPGGNVYALAQIGTTLYVGGAFDGTNLLPTTKALFQVALASTSASPSSSTSTRVGSSGGSIAGGAIYTMAKKRIGSGDTADNYIYIGGTFTDLGLDTTGDRIGLVHPTINEITLGGSISDVGMDASPVSLTAESDSGQEVSANNATPSVCTWANNLVTLRSIGTCTITFTQSGGSGYAAATPQTVTFEVLKGNDNISFPILSNRTYSPSAFDPAVTATSGRTPTFQVAAGSSSVCQMVSGAISMLTAGSCEVTASLADNSDWNAAEDVTRSFTVTQAPQTITFTQPGEQEVGTNLTLSASSSSGLSISYSSSSTGVCSVSGSSVTFNAGGDCTIISAQAGNTQYEAASNVSRTFKVWPTSRYDLSWNTWEFPSNALSVGSEAAVRALAQQAGNAGATTEVDWTVSTPSVCSISASLGNGRRTVAGIAPGTCTLSLSRTSDATYRALSARQVSVTIEATTTTTTAPPVSETVPTTTVVASPTTIAATSSGSSVLTVNNTYVLPKAGKTGFKPVTVPLKPTVKGEVISKLSSSPRTVCNAGNFGTSKKPVWKVVMSKPGRCAIKMTLKTATGKLYNSSTTIIVR